MNNSAFTFGRLLSPTSVETFYSDIYGKCPLHVAGSPEKFGSAFSWTELNRLLDMSGLWSDQSMKLVLDGRVVEPSSYSFTGMTREGNPGLLPETKLVEGYLRSGATLVLDLVETLSSGIGALTRALALSTGSAIVCNAYCSWQAHQGFMAHFDTTDVFALHFEGSKTWRIYKGFAAQPVNLPGHHSSDRTPDEHARARIMCDLIHMAFVCDLTRVATLQITAFQSHMSVLPVSQMLGYDFRADLHELGHNGDTENRGQLPVSLMLQWHISHYAYLMDKLKNTPEGAGNALDNSVMVFTPEAGHGLQLNDGVSQNATHSVDNMVMLVGGHAGGLQPGQHIQTAGAHPAQCLVSAMRAAGYQGDTLGEVTGTIPELFGG